MARTKNGAPDKGRLGGWSYFTRQGESLVRIGTNLIPTDHLPTRAQIEQMSKMQNLINLWRCFRRELKGCFENKKPGATDYSGFLGANLPEARVFLKKGLPECQAAVVDNVYVAVGTLQPAVEVEECAEWMLSDICVGSAGLQAEDPVYDVSSSLVKYNNGAFQMGDELIFVRMRQEVNINTLQPLAETWIYRLRLDQHNRRSLEQELMGSLEGSGFEVVEGRLAVRRCEGELVAWIRLRRDSQGRTHVTTQRLVGSNPMVAKYMSREAVVAAVDSHKTQPQREGFPEALKFTQVVISASSNDIELGVAEGGGSYAPGAPVTLRAVAREGGRFLVWDDGCQEAVRQMAALQSGAFKAIFVRR